METDIKRAQQAMQEAAAAAPPSSEPAAVFSSSGAQSVPSSGGDIAPGSSPSATERWTTGDYLSCLFNPGSLHKDPYPNEIAVSPLASPINALGRVVMGQCKDSEH